MKDVNLWFAKDIDENVVLIEDSKYGVDYKCPVCNSKVIPKAINESSIISPHFAHIDKSKCNIESQIHWWTKNELLKHNDYFTVIINNEEVKYMVKDLFIEKATETSNGVYRPDLTVLTTNGDVIYFEIFHTNKKNIDSYYNIWRELNNLVVEIRTNSILEINNKNFNAVYHDGIVYNARKSKSLKAKESFALLHKKDFESINKVMWAIDDINRYLNSDIDIDYFALSYDLLNKSERRYIKEYIDKNCANILMDYISYKNSEVLKIFKQSIFYDELSYLNTEFMRLTFEGDSIYFGGKKIEPSEIDHSLPVTELKEVVIKKIKSKFASEVTKQMVDSYGVGLYEDIDDLLYRANMVLSKYKNSDIKTTKRNIVRKLDKLFLRIQVESISGEYCEQFEFELNSFLRGECFSKIEECYSIFCKNSFRINNDKLYSMIKDALGSRYNDYLSIEIINGTDSKNPHTYVLLIVGYSVKKIKITTENYEAIVHNVIQYFKSIDKFFFMCKECGEDIILSKRDVEFYIDKLFLPPKKCKHCKRQTKGD